MSFKVLDLFSGVGGFSLGLERTGGFETVAFCEIEPYCRAVLKKHWPGVPCYEDVRELTADTLRRDGIAVDVICGGFPCQDISLAGNGDGLEGERSGLWREFSRLIREIRPAFVIVENVAALTGRGLGEVLGDLAACWYGYQWDSFPTCLPLGHRRERTWIVAYALRQGLPERSASIAHSLYETPIFTRQRFASVLEMAVPREKWADQPLLGRGIHGLPGRVGRVAAAGNSINPQIPQLIGEAILEAEEMMPVSDEIHAETVKENRRLRKEIRRLKDENRFLEEQMIAKSRDHVETSRREAQRRAAAKFFDFANED